MTEGFGTDSQTIAESVVAGAGSVDNPLDGTGADEVEGVGAAFVDAEAGGGGEAGIPERGGGAAGGAESIAECGEAFGGGDTGGFVGIAEGEEDGGGGVVRLGKGKACAGGELALEVGEAGGGGEAHDLAGGLHFG